MNSSAPQEKISPNVPSARGNGSILELVGYFLRLGAMGFGGPVALCGQMEKDLVQGKG
jgi:chromate transporter